MTEAQIEQEKHYKEMAEAYIDKCAKARGFVILPMQLRNDFVDLYVAGAMEAMQSISTESILKMLKDRGERIFRRQRVSDSNCI